MFPLLIVSIESSEGKHWEIFEIKKAIKVYCFYCFLAILNRIDLQLPVASVFIQEIMISSIILGLLLSLLLVSKSIGLLAVFQ